MLWSSNDESTPAGGNPLDDNYDETDLTLDCLKKCVSDCKAFQLENADLLKMSELDDERAGHCFWLNRNGHGSGFWDEYSATICPAYVKYQAIGEQTRDFTKRDNLNKSCDCPYHTCQKLSKASNVWGTLNPYVYRHKINFM